MSPEVMEEEQDQNKLLTIDQVSNLIKIPIPTIRKYVKRFHPYIPVTHGARNACLYSGESVRKLVLVRSLFNQNMPHSEIMTLISGQEKVKRDHGQEEASKKELITAEEGSGQGGQFNQLHGQVLEIHKFQLDLIKKVEVMKDYYDSIQKDNQALKHKLSRQSEEASELTKRLWNMESEIRRLQKGQGFWATIKRWMGINE